MLRICALVIFLGLLAGCAGNPFYANPFTGGVGAEKSALLNISLPAGLEVYPSHGYMVQGANGANQGLETFRGYIDGYAAASDLFNTLNSQGWQLRMYLRKGQRALYLYQKDQEFAVLTFHLQGMLTILEIWKGSEQSLNMLPYVQDFEPGSLDEDSSAEALGQANKPDAGQQGSVEEWGGEGLEERDI